MGNANVASPSERLRRMERAELRLFNFDAVPLVLSDKAETAALSSLLKLERLRRLRVELFAVFRRASRRADDRLLSFVDALLSRDARRT